MMKTKEPLDEFFGLVEKYKAYSVIVEGKKDKRVLENLGFTKIKILNKALYKIVEEFDKGDKLLILTDLDKKGKELYGKLKKELVGRGVKIDDVLRKFLFKNFRLQHIEGLESFLRKNKA